MQHNQASISLVRYQVFKPFGKYLTLSYKIIHTVWSCQIHSQVRVQEKETDLYKSRCTHSYNNFIYNHPKLETSQVSSNRQMGKQCHTHAVDNSKTCRFIDIHYNMYESQVHPAKELDSKDWVIDDSAYHTLKSSGFGGRLQAARASELWLTERSSMNTLGWVDWDEGTGLHLDGGGIYSISMHLFQLRTWEMPAFFLVSVSFGKRCGQVCKLIKQSVHEAIK